MFAARNCHAVTVQCGLHLQATGGAHITATAWPCDASMTRVARTGNILGDDVHNRSPWYSYVMVMHPARKSRCAPATQLHVITSATARRWLVLDSPRMFRTVSAFGALRMQATHSSPSTGPWPCWAPVSTRIKACSRYTDTRSPTIPSQPRAVFLARKAYISVPGRICIEINLKAQFGSISG